MNSNMSILGQCQFINTEKYLLGIALLELSTWNSNRKKKKKSPGR
jgi:hypothetical protein